MFKFVFGVQYDGSEFFGWQRQPKVPTVQAALEAALSQIAAEPVVVQVAGRTDAGVHASGQVAAFTSSAERGLADWLRGLNGLTPSSIRILWVQPAPDDFHPRFTAIARRYQYVFSDQAASDPFIRRLAWCTQSLDADAMHNAAQALIGERDFSSFRAAGCQSLTAVRRVNRCEVRRIAGLVLLDIEANAFLLHMVRNIAASLQTVGTGQAELTIAELVHAKDRRLAAQTGPPQGLYLRAVRYSDITLPDGERPSLLNGVSLSSTLDL